MCAFLYPVESCKPLVSSLLYACRSWYDYTNNELACTGLACRDLLPQLSSNGCNCSLEISKTLYYLWFYIGLAVGLPVFSNISIILTHVQTVLSLQGKVTSETEWTDSLFSLFSLCISHFIINERFNINGY